MSLYKHQLDIITENPARTGLFMGTGSGKTLTALCLARGKTLVICPKTQKEDRNWERENEKNKLNVDLTVISKETFKRDHATLPQFMTVIIDEAHTCLGMTPNTRQRNKIIIPKSSQIFEAVWDYLIRIQYPSRIYLVTATIIKSPMTVFAAAKLLQHNLDFYRFRDMFYVRLPMPGREVWVPKNDSATKDKLAHLVRKLGYIGRLEDYFDVPEQTYKTFHIELTKKQKDRIKDMAIEYPDPIVRCGKIHQIENGILTADEFSSGEEFENGKIEKILELALEFPRMIIFVKYTKQIGAIAGNLMAKDYKVLIMKGDTKDRGKVLEEAKNASECIFIVQAQISAGWELPSYPCMVFASRTYSFVDYDQGLGRIQRADHIKKNLYINLVVKGGVDEAVDKCLKNKQSFNERLYEME